MSARNSSNKKNVLGGAAAPSKTLEVACRACKKKRAEYKCEACRSAYYCSAAHQTADWTAGHSAECAALAAIHTKAKAAARATGDLPLAAGCHHGECYHGMHGWMEGHSYHENHHYWCNKLVNDFDGNVAEADAYRLAHPFETCRTLHYRRVNLYQR